MDNSRPVLMMGRTVDLILVGMSFFFLGFVSGFESRNSEINTQECTIACPGNAESIKIEDDCYCKLQTIRDAVEAAEQDRREEAE